MQLIILSFLCIINCTIGNYTRVIKKDRIQTVTITVIGKRTGTETETKIWV